MRSPIRAMRQSIYEWPNAAPIPDSSVFLVPVTSRNVSDAGSLRSERLIQVFRVFLAEGRLGVYAYVEGVLIGHAWASRPGRASNNMNTYFRLTESASLIHYCYVAEDYRSRGVFRDMLVSLIGRLHETGCATIMIDTDFRNLSSRRGIEHAGFRYRGDRVYLMAGRHRVLDIAITESANHRSVAL